jgi:WD40 repeat protein
VSPPEPRPRVFLSYARSDGGAAARCLRERLLQAQVPLWRDREGMEGGRDWWQQITAAIDQVEVLVLLATPAALGSATVRREWRYARQRGVAVYPVTGFDDASGTADIDVDFDALPRWMRRVHFYDLRHEWNKFVNDLHTRPTRVRVPFMVEDLPADFVTRPAEYEQLLSSLLDAERQEPIAITTALRGAGGYGKTALARALCHDEAVQNAFDDGILWVTLGESPGNLTDRVEDLIYMLSGERPDFAGLDGACAALAELLADRSVLIVIDDAWDAAHVRLFLQGGPRCARLITTRRADVLPSRAYRVDVDAMSGAEALTLLRHALPANETEAQRAPLTALAARLGEWPLLLKLVNGALRERVLRHGQPLPQALGYVNKALDAKGLTHFDAREASERNAAVATTLGVSLAQLDDKQRERLHELAVFPEDVLVPLDLVAALWKRTGGVDEIDAEDLCEWLARLSLLLSLDLTARVVRLHDVVRQFLLGRLGSRVPALHAELLNTGRPASGAWGDLAPDAGYWWSWLFTHLRAADLHDELRRTATDLRYLVHKAQARSALAVEPDLAIACSQFPADAVLAQLRRSYTQATGLLAACGNAADAMTTLLARLAFVPGLEQVVAGAAAAGAPSLVCVEPPPDMPHPALIRTFGEHRGAMSACALSADGRRLAAAYSGRVVLIWDAAHGNELLALKDLLPRALAISSDGSMLAVATHDRRLVLLDVQTGRELWRGKGHVDAILAVALNVEHGLAVTASADHSLRVWDIATAATRHTLCRTWDERDGGWLAPSNDQGHWGPVLGCAISADGRLLASTSADPITIVWDAVGGRALRVLQGHHAAVNACAFSPDARQLATASEDHTLRVWDLATGSQRVLAGHDAAVKALAWSGDGAMLISASADGTLRRWDVASGVASQVYTGHTDWVVGCAVASAAGLAASASIDGTARVWNITVEASTAIDRTDSKWFVSACAAVPHNRSLFTTRANRGLTQWDADTRRRVKMLHGHEAEIRGCAASPDGLLVATASADKTLIVWNLADGRPTQTLTGHRDWVNACAFTPDSRVLISVSNDRALCLWDLQSRARRIAFVAHQHAVNACAVSPDGRWIISAGTEGLLRRWPLAGLDEALWEAWMGGQRELPHEQAVALLQPLTLEHHELGVNGIAFAPTCEVPLLAAASSDRTLSLWNVNDGRLLRVLRGHRHDVTGCAFSTDGQHLASVSADGCVKLWRVADGQVLSSLQVDGELSCCAFTGVGDELAVAGAMGVYFFAAVDLL